MQSRLDFANATYAGTSTANFDRLQLMQNTLARVVSLLVTWERDRILPILEHLNWLTVRRSGLQTGIAYVQDLSLRSPPHLRSQLLDYTPGRSLGSPDSHLRVPGTRLACASRAFSIAAP